jgi:hypothetical protein
MRTTAAQTSVANSLKVGKVVAHKIKIDCAGYFTGR